MAIPAAQEHRPVLLRMLAALGLLYLLVMGSTFSSLGVVLPHMIPALRLDWTEAGSGFTLLALAAGLCSMLPALLIRRWGGRVAVGSGVLAMMSAYAVLALCGDPAGYFAGALLLGVGFALAGAVPSLHLLDAWAGERRALVFGAFLACGGLGGATWPSVVEGAIRLFGGWRGYWWFMAGLMGAVGVLALAVIRQPAARIEHAHGPALWLDGLSLRTALRSPQFYVVGCAIAATYFTSSTLNAFALSYMRLHGVALAVAVATFSIQSAGHAAFPLLMGGIAGRVGVRAVLVFGLAIQAIGILALASSTSIGFLLLFAIGVGGGYGTVMIGTTLAIETYYGPAQFARIFGANQLFSVISVSGPAIAGFVADLTGGRFEAPFAGCAALLIVMAGAAALLQPPRAAGTPLQELMTR